MTAMLLSQLYPVLGSRRHSVENVRAAVAYLKLLRARRGAIREAYATDATFRRRYDVTGEPRVYLKTDPEWLVDMAINRRAGWPDDPWTFGTTRAVPFRGRGELRIPRIVADGNRARHLRQLARQINTPRLRIYKSELGEWSAYLLKRLPNRFVERFDD